jgi:hypothetical protein
VIVEEATNDPVKVPLAVLALASTFKVPASADALIVARLPAPVIVPSETLADPWTVREVRLLALSAAKLKELLGLDPLLTVIALSLLAVKAVTKSGLAE